MNNKTYQGKDSTRMLKNFFDDQYSNQHNKESKFIDSLYGNVQQYTTEFL